MALTKTDRAALPDDDFAVPGKRKLPMHDGKHVAMAWRDVGHAAGLSDVERAEARFRLKARADTFGIDTADWAHLKRLDIAAMALMVPDVADHPNRMPFSGVLTRIGIPSDFPPSGSGGRCVVLTPEGAEKALPSLLGMAVDLTADLDGHDAQAKVGLITEALIEGDEIRISGFIYASDFPDEAARIRADKDVLGFSFEAVNILVADPCADPLAILDCVFTGAAILRKDKAAYQTTSLSAAADEDFTVTKEEIAALLADGMAAAMKPIADRLEKIENAANATNEKLEASKAVMEAVEPFAAALETAATGMEAAGIGCASDSGYVALLRKMAGNLRATAALGKTPDGFYDLAYYASADRKAPEVKVDAAAIAKAVEDAMKPLAIKVEAAEANAKLADERAKDAETRAKDAENKRFAASAEPGRKTLPPIITSLLARADLTLPEGDGKLAISKVDEAFGKAGLTRDQRLQAKTALAHAGVLA